MVVPTAVHQSTKGDVGGRQRTPAPVSERDPLRQNTLGYKTPEPPGSGGCAGDANAENAGQRTKPTRASNSKRTPERIARFCTCTTQPHLAACASVSRTVHLDVLQEADVEAVRDDPEAPRPRVDVGQWDPASQDLAGVRLLPGDALVLVPRCDDGD